MCKFASTGYGLRPSETAPFVVVVMGSSLAGFSTTVTMRHMDDAVNGNDNTVISATQVRMARAAVGLGVRELAALASLSPNTVARLERGEELKASTLATIRSALEAAGVDFTATNGWLGVRVESSSLEVFEPLAADPRSALRERGRSLRIISVDW